MTRSLLFCGAGMELTVKNANVEKVLNVMDVYLGERYANICCCDRCKNDIIALALNYLPPHYYVENENSKDLGSPWVMVETAVAEAIDRVIEYPNHPEKPKVA